MKKIMNDIVNEYNSKSKKVLIVYLMLCLIVIICLIREIINSNIGNILLCTLTLILFLLPSIIHIKVNLLFSDILEIMIYILIFSSVILGEVLGFYTRIEIFDTILHLFYGFVVTGIGFSLINIFYSRSRINFNKAFKYLVLFGFCYGMTSGVMWEIFEYSADKIFDQDMQDDTIITEISSIKFNDIGDNKPETVEVDSLIVNGKDFMEEYGGYIDIGLNDTMKDLIFNLVGSLLFSIMGYAYLKGKCNIISNFMIKKSY